MNIILIHDVYGGHQKVFARFVYFMHDKIPETKMEQQPLLLAVATAEAFYFVMELCCDDDDIKSKEVIPNSPSAPGGPIQQ